MVIIKIFDVDSQNDTPLSILQVGEHVLGRGSFTNSVDKRISRKHAIINVQDNQATLTSVHVNPCFYISETTPKVQILNKDIPVHLADGDKFAFVSDYWYRVKILSEKSEGNNNSSSISSAPICNTESSLTVVASCSGIQATSPSPIKRSLEELNSEGRKKLKTINESLDQLLDNIKKIESQDFSKENGGDKGTNNTENNRTFEVFRKKDISDSDDEDSDWDGPAEVTRDVQIVTNEELSKTGNDGKEEEHSNSSGDESKDKDHDSEDALGDVQKEPMVNTTVENDLPGKVEVAKDELSNSSPEGAKANTEEPPIVNPVNDAEDNDTSSQQQQGDAAAAAAATTSATSKLRREQCWYGGNCYRKNAGHRDQFSHPGDPDYDEDPDDDRPECAYGAQCYRNNQTHRKQYKHTNSRPATKPATTGNKRKRRAATAARKVSDDDTDSLDEDDDAFIDDSSSSENYDEDDSDTDYSDSQNVDDTDNTSEVKLLFKEAKKFLTKKRKD